MQYAYFRKASYHREFIFNKISEEVCINLMYDFLDILGSPYVKRPHEIGECVMMPSTGKKVISTCDAVENISVNDYAGTYIRADTDYLDYKIAIFAHPGSEAWIKLDKLESVFKAYLDML
jgi:hypothetical protein